MHKNRDSEGGKLKFGPVWDFNLGFGNVDYCTQGNPEGLVILNFNDVCSDDYWVIHFWWKKFLEDEAFYSQLKMRWKTLRQKEFSENRVNHLIDSISVLLNKAQVRNFQKWPVLGQYVWPNYYIGNTYSEEVNHLKSWIDSRFAYLDKVWEIKTEVEDTTNYTQLLPNPTADLLTISFAKKVPKDLTISLYDTNGSSFVVPIIDLDENQINLDLSNLPTGLFILRMSYPESSSYYKIVKI
ncbi:MAG: CotH kinase family protein [Saprospiraceae bacterium]|nr:CotH kinase family protein [Saprospiraceae bacterium]